MRLKGQALHAHPRGTATTQLACLRAAKTCSRSVSSSRPRIFPASVDAISPLDSDAGGTRLFRSSSDTFQVITAIPLRKSKQMQRPADGIFQTVHASDKTANLIAPGLVSGLSL
jgi:hypothetical protein